MSTIATISERGNGFPDAGDYIHGRPMVWCGDHYETVAPGITR